MAEPLSVVSRQIAADLLSIAAVSFAPDNPYTWASGLRSPVYCDNRLTMGYVPVRRAISAGFAACIDTYELHPEVIAGTATAGIPHAAWLAERLSLPMVYVRSKPKAHGRGHQVEGSLEGGRRVVVIEDLVSTGMSSVAAAQAVQAVGAEVVAVLAIFSYGLPAAATAFEAAGIPLYTLTTFDTLLNVAEVRGLLAPEAVTSLQVWHQDPEGWSLVNGHSSLGMGNE